jgi:ketosteroid isomerase-like protein
MEEYVFEEAEFIMWQKWLNQWRHTYKLEILHIEIKGDNAVILLKRTLKTKQHDNT